jgi:serine/threonine protein kinase
MQLLAVTAFSHHHKIMHRDIKPENILITPEGQLKLLDFGIARDLTWQKPDTVSEGTLNFMPPEQFQGRSSLASDVWALGVILYVLATGCYPLFQQNNLFPMDVETDSTIPAPHDLDPRVSDKLEQVIMKCLESDPEKRYADAVALQEDILKSLPGFGKGLILPEHPAPATTRF